MSYESALKWLEKNRPDIFARINSAIIETALVLALISSDGNGYNDLFTADGSEGVAIKAYEKAKQRGAWDEG